MFIVTKHLKRFLKNRGLRCPDETIETIEKELKKICLHAADTAQFEGLKTLRPDHIPSMDLLLGKSKKSGLKKPRSSKSE